LGSDTQEVIIGSGTYHDDGRGSGHRKGQGAQRGKQRSEDGGMQHLARATTQELKHQDIIKILNVLKAEVQPSEELLKVGCRVMAIVQ
jgi:hypothetical protein